MPPVNRTNKPLRFKEKTSRPMIFPLQPDNISSAYTRKRRRSVNGKAIIIIIILLIIAALCAYIALYKNALAIMVNGETVGCIEDMKTTEQELNALVLAKLKEDAGNNIEITDTISLKPVNSLFRNVSKNTEQVIANVCKAVSYKQEATTILVEDKEMAIVSNVEEARKVLQTILDNYACPPGTSEPQFAIKINTGSTFVDSEEVSTVEEAVKLLSTTKTVEREHTVVQGESFGGIAAQAGMTESELLAANPSITEATKTKLQIGQKIKTISTVPTLAIRTFKVTTETQDIPYQTVTQENSSQPSSYSRVRQEGKNGKKEVTTRTPYINGEQIGDPVTSENITEKPVNRIVEIGTYVQRSTDNSDSSDDDSSSEEE